MANHGADAGVHGDMPMQGGPTQGGPAQGEESVNNSRRRFLTATTAVVGAVGAGFLAVPFIKSWNPSERAKLAGAPVSADIAALPAGQQLTLKWRGQPVYVAHRSEQMLATLEVLEDRLLDPNSTNTGQQPEYANNPHRSIRPEIMVLVAVCTHLGCAPEFVPEVQPQPFDPNWKGGYFCPCHKSRYDLAGRVFQGQPAPANLPVPPYHFENDSTVVIGVGPEQSSSAGAA